MIDDNDVLSMINELSRDACAELLNLFDRSSWAGDNAFELRELVRSEYASGDLDSDAIITSWKADA